MPQIIVTARPASDREQGAVMLRERVNPEDFESERFAANLIERLGWAVVDATEEARPPRGTEAGHTARSRESRHVRRSDTVHA